MSADPNSVHDQVAIGEQGAIGEQPSVATKSDKQKTKAAGEFYKSAGTGQQSMNVKVRSPFRDYYDGEAFSISAENATGPFDILPKHHSFISLLSPCELIIRTVDQGEQKIRISGGIMHVKTDRAIVFLDV